jgi:hypothetical protein
MKFWLTKYPSRWDFYLARIARQPRGGWILALGPFRLQLWR